MKIHTTALITLGSPALLFLLGCGGSGSGSSTSTDPNLPAAYYACVINDGSGEGLTTYDVDATTGAVGAQKDTESFPSSASPQRLVAHPTLPVVYFTAEDDRVYAYSIAPANGSLTHMESEDTGVDPRSVAVTPDGNYLYVGSDERIDVYSLDDSGRMDPRPNFNMGANNRADELAVDPLSNYVYALNKAAFQLHAYAIRDSDGALSEAQTAVPLSVTPNDLAVYSHSVYVNNIDTTVLRYAEPPDFHNSPITTTTTTGGLASTVIGNQYYRSDVSTKKVFAFSIAGGAWTAQGGSLATTAAATRLMGGVKDAFLYTVHKDSDTIGWLPRDLDSVAAGTLTVHDSPVDMAVVKVR